MVVRSRNYKMLEHLPYGRSPIGTSYSVMARRTWPPLYGKSKIDHFPTSHQKSMEGKGATPLHVLSDA